MTNLLKVIAFSSITMLMATTALASTADVKQLPQGEKITLSGTVDQVDNEREFTIRDDRGTTDVNIESNQSVVLQKGDSVTVNGTVDRGMTGTEINATEVTVHKDAAAAMGDAIEGATGLSVEQAKTYTIQQLPKEGLVKVSGTVSDVDNEKEFTLKDGTGSIKIKVESAQSAALTEGAQVTVVGQIDNGVLGVGKNIEARKVTVDADTQTPKKG